MTAEGKAQTGGTPLAFAFLNPGVPPTTNDDSATTFLIDLCILAGDGSATPFQFSNQYVYDTTLPAATNVANLKAAVAASAAFYFPTITSSNVTLLLGVN